MTPFVLDAQWREFSEPTGSREWPLRFYGSLRAVKVESPTLAPPISTLTLLARPREEGA